MSFKDILVHIDDSPNSASRVAVAAGLAQRCRAHLAGLYVISHPHYSSQHNSTPLKASEAQALFEQATAGHDISSEWMCVDWTVAGVSISEIVGLYAYHRDLVIVGQTDPLSLGETPPDLPQRLVMTSGRPVLVAPYAGRFETVGERVMVAWKAGRESVRALNDAMPFLKSARKVSLVGVEPPGEGAGKAPADICGHLARHEINAATAQLVSRDIPVGDMLLNQAWEEGCDLLVMGAYTRTPKGALTLGPVARHVLKHMTIPILMSH